MKKTGVLLVLILSIGCSSKSHVSFIFDKDIVFVREAGTNNYFYCQCDSNLFIGNPYHSSTLYFHDLRNGNIIRKIEFPSLKYIQGFYFDLDSSVYYCPFYSSELFRYNIYSNSIDTIINMDIQMLSQLKMEGVNIGNAAEFVCAPRCPLIVRPPHYFVSNVTVPGGSKSEQVPLFHFLTDKDVFQLGTSVGKFPDSYYSTNKTLFPFDAIITYTVNDDNQILLSYAVDHNVYVYDFNERLCLEKTCKSKYADKLPEGIPYSELQNDKVEEDRFNNATFYTGVLYDKYRRCYYRFVHLPKPKRNKNTRDFSIMLLDEDLNVIGEQRFKGAAYDYAGAQVVPQGLLLPKNDDYSGNTKFGLFKVKWS